MNINNNQQQRQLNNNHLPPLACQDKHSDCAEDKKILNGCLQIAKELVENATITHPYFQESHNLLIANGLHGQSRDIVQDLVEMEFKFLLDLS